MRPAIRTQNDELQDLYSSEAGLTIDPSEDRARQEFKEEADLNVLLRRYGVVPPGGPLQFGQVDYDLDLQTAHLAVRQAQEAYQRLPLKVRAKYPSWLDLAAAVNSGEFKGTEGDTVPVSPEAPPAEG